MWAVSLVALGILAFVLPEVSSDIIPDLTEYKSQLLAKISEDISGAEEDVEGGAIIETDDDEDTGSPMHRTNFAAASLGASIMASNKEMTGPKSLLVSDADAYALSRCDAKKFVVIQLSEDVMLDEIVVSNEERYSSSVHQFRVTGSLKYPATEWVVLGNFTAENRLGEQRFSVLAKTFVRYVKLTWLSHYGHEFYCTWTRVQAFGSTLIEDLQSNIYTTDAQVQSMKQQISAAHAAVQQQQLHSALSTGVVSRIEESTDEDRGSVGPSHAGPPSSVVFTGAMPQSFSGVSGPVCVAVPLWSLHGVVFVFSKLDVLSDGLVTSDTVASPLSNNHSVESFQPPAAEPSALASVLEIPSSCREEQPTSSATPAAFRCESQLSGTSDSTPSAKPLPETSKHEGNKSGDSDLSIASRERSTAVSASKDALPDVLCEAVHTASAVDEPASGVVVRPSENGTDESKVASDDTDDEELQDITRRLNASFEVLQSVMSAGVPHSSSLNSENENVSVTSTPPASADVAVACDEAILNVTSDASADECDTTVEPGEVSTDVVVTFPGSHTSSATAAPVPPPQQPATVFKQLTRKLKELEIDQSVMSSYLNDLRTSYSTSISNLHLAVESLRNNSVYTQSSRDTKIDALAHAVFEMREALALLYRRHVSLLNRMHTLEGVSEYDEEEEEGEEEEEEDDDEVHNTKDATGPVSDTDDVHDEEGRNDGEGWEETAMMGSYVRRMRDRGALQRVTTTDGSTRRSQGRAGEPDRSGSGNAPASNISSSNRCGLTPAVPANDMCALSAAACVDPRDDDPRRLFYAGELATIEELREAFSAVGNVPGADDPVEGDGAPTEEPAKAGKAAASQPPGRHASPGAAVAVAFAALLNETQRRLLTWGAALSTPWPAARKTPPTEVPVIAVPAIAVPVCGGRSRCRSKQAHAAKDAEGPLRSSESTSPLDVAQLARRVEDLEVLLAATLAAARMAVLVAGALMVPLSVGLAWLCCGMRGRDTRQQ